MEQKTRICATDRIGYSIVLGIFGLFLILSIWVYFGESAGHGLTGAVVSLAGMGLCAWHLIDLRYLDEDGITCTQFGRVYRRLPWSEVAQVHKLHRHNISAKTSSQWVIVVTPVGCPAYVPGKSCSGHLADCDGRAILLDDSKQNRAYIAKAWGRVIVMDTRGNIIE